MDADGIHRSLHQDRIVLNIEADKPRLGEPRHRPWLIDNVLKDALLGSVTTIRKRPTDLERVRRIPAMQPIELRVVFDGVKDAADAA